MIEVTESDRIAAKELISEWQASTGDMTGDAEQAFATHRIEAAKAERDRIVAWLREAQVEAMKQGKLEASAAMTGFADALESKPKTSQLMRDLANTGLAVTKDGQRVDPMDFYAGSEAPDGL